MKKKNGNQGTSSAPSPARSAKRFPTGIAGLDKVLKGGFIRSDSYVIIGQPGTGKTTLANQIAFDHIAGGGRVVFLTVLTETHSRMIGHLSSMSFFELEAVNETLHYISGYGTLQKEGLPGLLTLLQNLFRQYKPSLFILDGLATVEEFAVSGLDFKSFIMQLDNYSELSGCTTLMLTHRGGGSLFQPEYTMVDGVIELSDDLVGTRNQRSLHVRKFRGSSFLQGLHSLEITGAGIEVHPRTEALLANSGYSTAQKERVPFGIGGLDKMLQGGLLANTCTIMVGPTGSCKTLLGLQFLAGGLALGEHCLILGFYESPADLTEKALGVGLHLERYEQEGLFQIIWQPPLEWDMDGVAEKLLDGVRQHQVKRVFIDAFGAFQQIAVYPERLPRFWAALVNELRRLEVTVVFAYEMPTIFGGTVEVPFQGVSVATENMILLRHSELDSKLRHLISIIKVRDSNFDGTVHEFTVSDKGIEIGDPFSKGHPVLRGISGGELAPKA